MVKGKLMGLAPMDLGEGEGQAIVSLAPKDRSNGEEQVRLRLMDLDAL